MSTRRAFLSSALAGAVLTSLAACATEVPSTPTATGTAAPQPVLDSERLAEVLARIQSGLETADAAKSADDLAGYLTGPALRIRTEEYVAAAATGDDSIIHAFDMTSNQADAVALSKEFPRTAINITDPDPETGATFMFVLTQDSARDPFQLWAWSALFAKINVPKTPTAAEGSEEVTAQSTGLVATPEEVVAAYVDALNDPTGENGTAFADDILRQRLAAERASDLGGFGSITVTAAAGTDDIRGLRTSEGGALFTATLSFDSVYALTTAGANVRLSGNVAAMLGDDVQVHGTVTAHYDVVVSFVVPPQGSSDEPMAIGADFVLASVSRDDSATPA